MDVTKAKIIGYVTTKPLTFHSEKEDNIEVPATTYPVVDVFYGNRGDMFYVTNQWHKPHKGEPLVITDDIVEKYVPIEDFPVIFLKKAVLNDFQSGSSLDFHEGKIFVVGDDAKHILALDTDFKELERFKLFDWDGKRIAKDKKADLETSTVIDVGGIPHILVLGSGAKENRCTGFILNTDLNVVTEQFKYNTFVRRLKDAGIKDVNIEGSAIVGGKLLLVNRGNKTNPDNFLIVTDKTFWEDQAKAPISLSLLKLPVLPKDIGISEICYNAETDTLLFTATIEDTANAIDDGGIGDSYVGYIQNITEKLAKDAIIIEEVINLTHVSPEFKGQKIEGICIEGKDDHHLIVNLVSDNDNDESQIFKILFRATPKAAKGKVIAGVENEGKPKNFEDSIFVHETEKKTAKIIDKVGLRKSQNKVIISGIYTIPQDWREGKLIARSAEYHIKLKPGSKIFWTDSERPMNAVFGFGNKFYGNLYKDLIKKTSVKNVNDVIKLAGTGDKWFKWKAEFSRVMEVWLKENGYCGIQHGGEIIITDLDCIESTAKKAEDGLPVNKSNIELLERAKALGDNVKGGYAGSFKGNEERFLFEVAIQANTNKFTHKGAILQFGEELVSIAQKLYPNVKLGDTFYHAVDHPMNILYLHGLDATPESDHAEILNRDNVNIIAPHLVYENGTEMFDQLCSIIKENNIQGIVGHSYGGYFAYCLSNKFRIPCLMLTPYFGEKNSLHHPAPDQKEPPYPKQMLLVGAKDDMFIPADQMKIFKKSGCEIFTEQIGHDIPDDIKTKYFDKFISGLMADNGSLLIAATNSNFKSWFGKSKVVENKTPLVVYHGTADAFNEFKKPKENKMAMRSDVGFWFTTSKEEAGKYGTTIIPVYLSIQNPLKLTQRKLDEMAVSYPAHKLISEWKEQGYDGIYVEEIKADKALDQEYQAPQWVAFNPTQIKIADGSNKTFDGNNPDIRFYNGGSVSGWKAIKGKDVIGRDIPNWDGAIVYHSTSKKAAKDIKEKGYRFISSRSKPQAGYYGVAISFTPDIEYTSQFGDVTTVAKVSDNARILNLNDENDWQVWKGLMGTGKDIANYRKIALENNIDGIYDPGAGDLFIYNNKVVTYMGTTDQAESGTAVAELKDVHTLNSFHDWLRFDSPDAGVQNKIFLDLRYSGWDEDAYLKRMYPTYRDKFQAFIKENPHAYYKDGGEVNTLGGYDYKGKDVDIAKKFDLITLPEKVEGTNCSNCMYVKILDAKKGLGFCMHKDIRLPVTAKMCCALWDNKGASRSWTAKHGMAVNHSFKYEHTPDEKWDVEYEWDRDYPIISSIRDGAGNEVDIEELDVDMLGKISEAAYQDNVERLIEQEEYRREDFEKGGVVVTKISDIPGLKKKVDAGQVTYRGLGMGKLSNEFYKLTGESGVRIKVDGKEYFITDTEFRELNWDFKKGEWLHKIRFAAPHRRAEDGANILQRVEEIRSAFIAEDQRLAGLPETEEMGNPFTICTNGAKWLKEKFFPEAKVMGYSTEKNPTALIGQIIGGHDFLVIDDKYILDFWYNNVCGESNAPVFLDIKKDTELVAEYYGDPSKWETLAEDGAEIKEHDMITLLVDVGDVKAGSEGAVVHIYPDKSAYEVEFEGGKVIPVLRSQIRDYDTFGKPLYGKSGKFDDKGTYIVTALNKDTGKREIMSLPVSQRDAEKYRDSEEEAIRKNPKLHYPYIDYKVEKRQASNIVMLPTEDDGRKQPGAIWKFDAAERLIVAQGTMDSNVPFRNYHLYEVSDGQPLVGDYAYAHQYGIVSKVTEYIGGSSRDIVLENMPHTGTFDRRQLQKVIASTDPALCLPMPFVSVSEYVEIHNRKLKAADGRTLNAGTGAFKDIKEFYKAGKFYKHKRLGYITKYVGKGPRGKHTYYIVDTNGVQDFQVGDMFTPNEPQKWFDIVDEQTALQFMANGGPVREDFITLKDGTTYFIDKVPDSALDKRTKRMSEQQAIEHGINLVFLKNFENDPSALDIAATEMGDTKQPTEAQVRRAMILKIGYEGFWYALKAGGESASDHLYSSSLSMDMEGPGGEDVEKVLIKKFNKDFKKVLITEDEIREIKNKIIKFQRRGKKIRDEKVESIMSFLVVAEAKGKYDTNKGQENYNEQFRDRIINMILEIADNENVVKDASHSHIDAHQQKLDWMGDKECLYILDEKYMTPERCKEETKKEKERERKFISLWQKLENEVISRMSHDQAATDGKDVESIPVMDEETYLATHGASRQDIGDSALHKNRGSSEKAWKRIVDHQAKKDADLIQRRQKLREEYWVKVGKGELRPPTRIEKLIETAQGHSDNESVQAARRLLEKKGISWQKAPNGAELKMGDLILDKDINGSYDNAHQLFHKKTSYVLQYANRYGDIKYKVIAIYDAPYKALEGRYELEASGKGHNLKVHWTPFTKKAKDGIDTNENNWIDAQAQEKTSNGIPFTEDIVSHKGASFVLYPKSFHKESDIKNAKHELRDQRDVVSIKVAGDFELDDLYKSAYFRDPRVRPLKWYQIEQDERLIRRERKKGTPPAEFVEKYVLPFTEETEKKYRKQHGESIYQFGDGGKTGKGKDELIKKVEAEGMVSGRSGNTVIYQVFEGHSAKMYQVTTEKGKKTIIDVTPDDMDEIMNEEFRDGGEIKHKKIDQLGNESVYRATDGETAVVYSITRVKDKKGTLLRMENSKTGLFESYSMDEIKNRIKELFVPLSNINDDMFPRRIREGKRVQKKDGSRQGTVSEYAGTSDSLTWVKGSGGTYGGSKESVWSVKWDDGEKTDVLESMIEVAPTIHKKIAADGVKIEPVHISKISVGDTIEHNGEIRTVSGNNIKRDPFMGITLFGDSYSLGNKPVNKVVSIDGAPLKFNGGGDIDKIYKEAKQKFGTTLEKLEDDYEVELSAEPNPDHGQDSHEGTVSIKPTRVKAINLEEARNKVVQFIMDNDLGAGNWTGGDLYKNGKKVGYISYNGRAWNNDGTPLFENGGVLLEEMINADIIDEEHPMYREANELKSSTDTQKINELLEEMINADLIDKSSPYYKRAKAVLKGKAFQGTAVAPNLAGVMSFEDFSIKLPEINSPFVGEEGVTYKPKYSTYAGKMMYFKHGRKNLTSLSTAGAYTNYLYDKHGIRFRDLSLDDRKRLFGKFAPMYKLDAFEEGGPVEL